MDTITWIIFVTVVVIVSSITAVVITMALINRRPLKRVPRQDLEERLNHIYPALLMLRANLVEVERQLVEVTQGEDVWGADTPLRTKEKYVKELLSDVVNLKCSISDLENDQIEIELELGRRGNEPIPIRDDLAEKRTNRNLRTTA